VWDAVGVGDAGHGVVDDIGDVGHGVMDPGMLVSSVSALASVTSARVL
jgi:hypothetical protein